jgi:hypothetical protein
LFQPSHHPRHIRWGIVPSILEEVDLDATANNIFSPERNF